MNAPAEWVSHGVYARHRGVTPGMVTKYIRAGKIPESAIRKDRRGHTREINVAAADYALDGSVERLTLRAAAAAKQEERDAITAAAGIGDLARDRRSESVSGLTDLKKVETFYAALQAQMDYRREVGETLEVKDVSEAAMAVVENLRQDIGQIHARAEDIAAAYSRGGVIAVRMLLRAISDEVCNRVSVGMQRLKTTGSAHAGGGSEEVAA